MKLCEQCFSIVDEKALFCNECGASVNKEVPSEGSDGIVYREISKASVFRFRKQFDEAEKELLAILHRFPNNATAHVLLGDIHSDKGEHQKAVEWYELAHDILPDNLAIKSKLNSEKIMIEKEESSFASRELEASPNSNIYWWMFGLSFIVLIAVGVIAFLAGSNRAKSLHNESLEDISQPISINEPPAGVTPNEKKENSNSESSNLNTTSSTPIGQTSYEKTLHSKIVANLGATPAIARVQFDPRTNSAWITVLANSDIGEQALRISVARTASAAFVSEPQMMKADVRVVDPSTQGLLFIATVNRVSYEAAKGAINTIEWADSMLSETRKP